MAAKYPRTADEVLSTIRELFFHQGNSVLTDLLDTCTAQIIDDTEDTGYLNSSDLYYIFILEAPPAVFATYEKNIEQVEKAIDEKLSFIRKGTGIHQLYKCRVTPQMRQAGRATVPSEDKIAHIWKTGQLRLFISHLTADKVAIGELRDSLALFGVAGFVAHADIKPTRAWEEEILLALGSMQALVAIITPDFKKSTWTNQEIGVAIGRGIDIISVKIEETDPPGFIGSRQAMKGQLNNHQRLASSIVDVVLKLPATALPMREAIFEHFVNSTGKVQTQECLKKLQAFEDITKDEAQRLQAGFNNEHITEAFYVPGKLTALIQRQFPRFKNPLEIPVPDEDDIPF